MNKLDLCKAVLQGTGHAGQITTTVGQRGILARISDWVSQAYLDIQRLPIDWRWMRVRGYTANLSVDKDEYTPTEMLISDLRRYDMDSFGVYDTDTGVSDTTKMDGSLQYETFRDRYLLREKPTGRPRFVIAPEHSSLVISPVPDTNYMIIFDYWQTPRPLSQDTSTPDMPERFHDMIVHGALSKYAVFDDAPEIFEAASQEYNRLFRELYREQAVVQKKQIRLRPIA